ncbi:hydrogenase-4 component F [Ruminiclostridium sufflavum DSM 19573]|uniref:Hydrogenase-4 component F n=1 Tax=Ruminiclostridium sufflavum DSM 19573 TaxID=1121337 RepID=A0A318XLM9_9FIRM|nr:hydrogenase 4 subunit F [Ruminiclostridium sufflavum]PYG87536.1 hydrogenase-4 component F [Ruminiclostridium sufflavum DSM 19573]
MISAFLAIPLIAGSFVWVTKNKLVIHCTNLAGALLLLIFSILSLADIKKYEAVTGKGLFKDLFYIDSLSGYILFITALAFFLVSLFSISYFSEELRRNVITLNKLKLYYSLSNAFVLAMLLALITKNMGVMWIAIEATTLASAFLVGFYNNKRAIEAAWKYLIICSVGIAFSMLGIILLYYSSTITQVGSKISGLNWNFMLQNASSLDPSILKIAFIFILIGFGTKVGFSPMHTWLPDAHSQAPSPVSALLSGVLLNTAMYGIIRTLSIVNSNLGNSKYTGNLLILLGLLSIATAAIFILVQQDYKRILAYSSIEHMGIIAIGLGICTPISVFAALYHVFNHAMTKSMLFLATGNVYLKYHTKKISGIRGLINTMPVTGLVFILGVFAITGMPPFGIFMSEFNTVAGAVQSKAYIAAVLLLVFLAVIFAGFIKQTGKMFYGNNTNPEIKKGELDFIGPAVLIILLFIIVSFGIYIPKPFKLLMDACTDIILGGM